MSCVPIQNEHLKCIIDVWNILIGYLRDPERRITELTNARDKLQCRILDLINKISDAECHGQTLTHQVNHWFTEVLAVNDEVVKIHNDHKNHFFRWSINRRAERCLAEITALGKDIPNDILTKLPPEGVQEVPGDPAEATNTMNSYLSKLQVYLKEDGCRIIGIWGMAGVGKTTLLRSLNDRLHSSSEKERGWPMFDYVIWAVVSKDYKLKTLQRHIANRLGLPLRKDSVAQAKEIMDFLKKKSFLLLLDDLWQPVDLAEVGIPQRTGDKKQKVIFTTRLEGVCGTMQARRKIRVECLNEAEAWRLFLEKVGDEALQAHPRILELAREVAKECGGLPLALVVIGSAMSTKKTPREWQNAITLLRKSRPYEIHGLDDKILAKLKFSYDNLADEILRQCFLLCSLWPEYHSISKTDLIECWMGHGLVDERKFDNINEAYDSGHALIGGLQAACLLEPGHDKDREVKMHDVVRDLALWISSDFGEKPNNFIVLSDIIAFEDSQREVERISLVRSYLSDTSGLPANCSKLKTLMLQKSVSFKSIVSGFLQGTSALTYLDISYTAIDELPQEIGLLGNLRYLNLSHTSIKSLPLQIGNLHELRFLLLRKLESIDIPCGVLEKLVMLSVIDMTDTWCNNWQELSRLHRCLKGVGIVLESIEDLHQLAHLPNVLTWRLVIRKLVGFKDPLQLLSPLQLGSRNIRSSIQMLKIEFCEHLEVVSMESDGDDNIQNWCLSRLEEVELSSLPELKEIIWRGECPSEMLPSLTVLTISGCHKLSNISWVSLLPCLEDLTVHHCSDMEQLMDVDNEYSHDGEEENGVETVTLSFPSLRRLRLKQLKSLRMFGGSFTFPSLEVLEVIDCPEMKTLPFGAEIAGKKLKMICGARKWWDELDMEKTVRTALLPYFMWSYIGTYYAYGPSYVVEDYRGDACSIQ